MNKTKLFLLSAIFIVIAGVVIYRLCNITPHESLPANERVAVILDDAGCIMCHAKGEKELPFYASFPIAKDLINEHIENGEKSENLKEALLAIRNGEKVNEVSLAKIEQSILEGTMPLSQYYLVHWGSSINKEQQDIITQWAADHRAKYYSTNLAHSKFSNEPIYPIHDFIEVDSAKVILGEMLYHDTRLSANNTVSCATCHDINTGGVDNLQFSKGIDDQIGGVNAPTVFNSVYNFVQFWDGRAGTLALQAAGPPLNPIEMGCASFDEIIAKLDADKEFKKQFVASYPNGFTEQTITDAIAEYEKTLITPNSKFDKYLKGDLTALNAREIEGYELFKENRCATCHVGVNLGGQSYEPVALYGDYFADRGIELTTEDNGRYKETSQERDRHRFKVPGLRNIELTAPYYHDGRYTTLEDATIAMGKYQLNKNFSKEDTDKIVAFMKSLTGEYKGVLLTNNNI